VAPPFRKAEFDILYNQGISREGDVIDLGVATGIIEKKGSWFLFGEEKLGQGRETVREILQHDAKLLARIEKEIRAKQKQDISDEMQRKKEARIRRRS